MASRRRLQLSRGLRIITSAWRALTPWAIGIYSLVSHDETVHLFRPTALQIAHKYTLRHYGLSAPHTSKMTIIPSTPPGTPVAGASTPSGNTLGGATTYYCCQCKNGPLSIRLCPACVHCGHYGCGLCETDATENISDREIAPATAAEILVYTNVSSNVDSTHHLPPATPSRSPIHKIPDMDVTPTICGHFSDEEPTDGGGYIWFCCVCEDGPMTCAINAACCSCGHERCGRCVVEPQK